MGIDDEALYRQMEEWDEERSPVGLADRVIPADVWYDWIALARQYDAMMREAKLKKPKGKRK